MKFLFHHRIASRDGQAVHLEELVAALSRAGHDVVIVGPAGFQQTGFGGSNRWIDWLKRSLPGPVYEMMEIAYSLKAFSRLHHAVKEHKPDIIYERFSLFLLAGIIERRLCGLPLILEVNAPLFEERALNDNLALHGVGRFFQKLIWRAVDHVLPVTHVLADYVRRYGVPEEKITVIPNGINPFRFADAPDSATAKAALGLSGKWVLGFTGFVRAWNKMETIIDILADHGAALDLHFLLVGDGPARADLERYAEQRGVSDRFTVTGVVERDDIMKHVMAFDIALQPGVTDYASPLKLFEYMYLGRGIVAPDAPNIREVLTDGHDALLFQPDDQASLRAAILRLCDDHALSRRLGQAARSTVEERGFTWDNNAARVEDLARRLIATARR